MITVRKLFFFLLAAASMLLTLACNGDDKPPAQAFDRRAMLTRYADELIIPAYNHLDIQVDALDAAIDDLIELGGATRLAEARQRWVAVYTSFQSANAFNFGPAGEAGTRKSLAEEIGTFPVNVALLEQYLDAGDASFNNFNRDTRGLFAIEYLLFAGSDATVLGRLADPNYRIYLAALSGHLDNAVTAVHISWLGPYRAAFIANDGADAGSSISALYNEFVRSYELLKNFKLGLPLGKRIGQSTTEPTKVEALYSGQSLQGLQAHFESLVRIWEGRAFAGGTGTGFREYLASVEGGTALIASTEAQIASVRQQINALVALNTPLSELITNNPAALEPLYAALSQHTRYWKSDMSSLLGISITFASGDGD